MPGSFSLRDISDVSIDLAATADESVLAYDSQTGKFVARPYANGLNANINAALAAAATPSASNPFAVLAGNKRLTIPATTTGKGPYVFETGDNSFSGTPDPTVVVGYNIAYNGSLILDGEPGAAWIIEADYNDGSGDNKLEMYAQYIPASGSGGIRPFMFQFNRDTNALVASAIFGNPVRLGYPVAVGDTPITIADFYRNQFILYGPDTASDTLIDVQAATGRNAGVAIGSNGVAQVAKFTPYNRNEFGIEVCNNASGTVTRNLVMSLFGFYGVSGYAVGIGERDNTSVLTASNKNGAATIKAITARGHASQSGLLISAETSAGAVVFGVEPDGDVRTARTAAATTLGSVVARLPIYDAAGTLVGYAPLYNSIT